MRFLLIVCLMLVGGLPWATLHAQSSNKQVFYIGHSLISPDIPAMVHDLAIDAGVGSARDYNYHIINGAPLRWNWTHADDGQNYQNQNINARSTLSAGQFNVLVMTEGIPLADDMVEYGGYFYDLAQDANATTQTYMYETWHWTQWSESDRGPIEWFNQNNDAAYHIEEGSYSFRELLTRFRPLWEARVDAINAAHPQHAAQPMRIIPAGTAFGRLYDAIEAGQVPGITSINQLFSDTIHPNEQGKYFVALVHFATIYGRSPEGLANQTKSEWGVNFSAPTAEQAAVFQRIAWEVVSNDPRTGVNATSEYVFSHGFEAE